MSGHDCKSCRERNQIGLGLQPLRQVQFKLTHHRMMETSLSKATINARDQQRQPWESKMRWASGTPWTACKMSLEISIKTLLGILVAALLASSGTIGRAQQPANSPPSPQAQPQSHSGDQPSDPGPLATGLSPA